MGLWKRISARLRGHSEGAGAERGSDVGMTYADLERDKPRKEAQLSGAGFSAAADEKPRAGARDPDVH